MLLNLINDDTLIYQLGRRRDSSSLPKTSSYTAKMLLFRDAGEANIVCRTSTRETFYSYRPFKANQPAI